MKHNIIIVQNLGGISYTIELASYMAVLCLYTLDKIIILLRRTRNGPRTMSLL